MHIGSYKPARLFQLCAMGACLALAGIEFALDHTTATLPGTLPAHNFESSSALDARFQSLQRSSPTNVIQLANQTNSGSGSGARPYLPRGRALEDDDKCKSEDPSTSCPAGCYYTNNACTECTVTGPSAFATFAMFGALCYLFFKFYIRILEMRETGEKGYDQVGTSMRWWCRVASFGCVVSCLLPLGSAGAVPGYRYSVPFPFFYLLLSPIFFFCFSLSFSPVFLKSNTRRY